MSIPADSNSAPAPDAEFEAFKKRLWTAWWERLMLARMKGIIQELEMENTTDRIRPRPPGF